MTTALVARGLSDPAAALASELGVLAFKRGFAEWSEGDRDGRDELTGYVLAALDELRTVSASLDRADRSSRSSAGCASTRRPSGPQTHAAPSQRGCSAGPTMMPSGPRGPFWSPVRMSQSTPGQKALTHFKINQP
ncbi:hypothetical protein [Streptomyces sp. NPDC095613]|uniref:hypothetical protein n=1 Tax=Streptomyces sp. NPDC095613 TaxID=3155540 RepID=UPI00332BFAE8